MLCIQIEQREWHTDFIVEITAGRKIVLLTECGAQDRGDHLFDRSLAIATGDTDHRNVEAPAPQLRDLTEGVACIRHDQRWNIQAVR